MRPYHHVKATCIIEQQQINPITQQLAWHEYESMTIEAPTMEELIERAQLYVGRPERKQSVLAIRLTGDIAYAHKEQDILFDHLHTVGLKLHVEKERSIPLSVSVNHKASG